MVDVGSISRRMTTTGDNRASNDGAARRRDEVKRINNIPPQHRHSPMPKPKQRPASKGPHGQDAKLVLPRPVYSYDYCAAFIIDPDGYRIEAYYGPGER